MLKCQAERLKRAWVVNRARGYPPKGYIVPNRKPFNRGENNLQRLGPEREAERIRKLSEALRATRKRERARIVFGLEQKTKLKVAKQPRQKVQLRWRLKNKGYIVDDVARIAYYTADTKRGKRIESKPQPWYKFQESVRPNYDRITTEL